MKNKQTGFIVPLLIAVIAVLLIGGISYVYLNKKAGTPPNIPTTVISASTSTVASSTPNNTTLPDNTISVPGMSQYTDTSFGFSFWYPSQWQIKTVTNNSFGASTQNGTVVKTISIGGEINLVEVHSPTMSFTDSGGAGPLGPVSYFFNPSIHSWMTTAPEVSPNGSSGATTTITSFVNTMGGLHIFGGTSRFDTGIIPLSAENFVVISDNGGVSDKELIETIVATDPSVATPLSIAEQTQTVHTEALIYGVLGTSIDNEWYVDNQYVYDRFGKIIAGANPSTFKTIKTYSDGFISSSGFATDGVHIYYDGRKGGEVLQGADPASFVLIRQAYQIPYAQTSGKYGQSFTDYDTNYEKDASHVWDKDVLLSGADPTTFVVTGDADMFTNTYNASEVFTFAHDTRHTYGEDTKGNATIDGVVVSQQL